MRKVQGIIALDLDGTLLNSRKQLTTRNEFALQMAAEEGWVIVPTTGRFYSGMPEVIRSLPFIDYAITINGAEVIDLLRSRLVYTAELPWKQAVRIMEWLDEFPVIYDCYMESSGWISQSHKDKADSVIRDPHVRKMVHDFRKPVPDLKAFITEGQKDVQKIQFFAEDTILRMNMMDLMNRQFKDIVVSSALDQNAEINQTHANKGEALQALAAYLGVDMENTMAIGDGLNDISMIKAAGLGVAMANGTQLCKDKADYVTLTNDNDGVAAVIEKYCLR